MLNSWAKHRMYHELEELPCKWYQKLNEHIKFILERHPETKRIYLTGSRINGTWVEEGMPEFTMWNEWRERVGLPAKWKTSDWDYVCDPQVRRHYGEIDLLNISRRKILIYEHRILF